MTTLQTSHLNLLPLNESHLQLLLELDSFPEVTRYLYPKPPTSEDVRNMHQRALAIPERAPGLGLWAGYVKDSSEPGEAIGWFMLKPSSRPDQVPSGIPADKVVEIGYRLLPKFWRKGYATEGARELLRYAFEDLKVRKVFGETMIENAGSSATMAKAGMREVRRFTNSWDEPMPGLSSEEVEFALTRQEWEEQAKTS